MQQGFLRFAGFVAILLCLSFSEIFGQITYFSRNSGSAWNLASSWSTVAFDNPTNTGTFPVAGDFVFIGGTGSNISISAAASCATLDIAVGSTLNINEGLSVSGTTLVNGNLSIGSTAGAKTFGGQVTLNGIWFEVVNEALTFQGGLSNNGVFIASNGLHTFGAAQTISGTLLIPRVRV
ncbi:MAG: hypothetical protein RIA63_08690, partial [Cyclobacteriaceae bacterium]